MRECTDDEPATISPTLVNFFATEYNDADCTEPTGNTEVLLGLGIIYGAHTDECVRYGFFDWHSMSVCRTDGSTITQFFGPDDDTCSGEVWTQVNLPTEFSVLMCSSVALDGFYYSLGSCTTDSATVWFDTPAPTFAPTIMGYAPDAYTPGPTAFADDKTPTKTPAPTTDVNSGGTADTPSPAIDIDDDAALNTPVPIAYDDGDDVIDGTAAPASNIDDNSAADTPAPTSNDDDEAVPAGTAAQATDVHDDTSAVTPSPTIIDNAGDVVDVTPAPAATDSRGVSVSVSPVAVPGKDEVKETTKPVAIDEAALANGAARGGSDAAFRSVVLSVVVGIFVRISLQGRIGVLSYAA